VSQEGVNAFDLIPSKPVSAETFIKAAAYLQQAYGIEYPAEKFSILFDLVREENWTEERFNRTVKWFLKTKYNQAWTIADWWQYNIRLYPFVWVRESCRKSGQSEIEFIKTLDVYLVDGVRLYKLKDGVDLPLERVV